MASATFSGKGSIVGGGDEVYVAAVPLRVSNGPAQLLMSAAYSLNLWDLKHFMVIIKQSATHQAFVYDFQPEDPENILVALAALSGSKVPGVIQVRKIGKLPTKKCRFVGFSRVNAVEAALRFNEGWETELKIGFHDCRDYCQALELCISISRSSLMDILATPTLSQVTQTWRSNGKESFVSELDQSLNVRYHSVPEAKTNKEMEPKHSKMEEQLEDVFRKDCESIVLIWLTASWWFRVIWGVTKFNSSSVEGLVEYLTGEKAVLENLRDDYYTHK